MQVLLLKDLAGKGKAGEVINVNDGYGKNFIIKNKIGVLADAGVLASVAAKKEANAFHVEEEKKAIREVITKLEPTTVTLVAKMGEGGKMFGSITGTEVARALTEAGFSIEKRNIVLPEPIKTLGTYKLKVKFSYGLEGLFTLLVKE
ncbi:MAG: 50S ribosomal protein L9 [Firmicutes bacterium]|nr:50S ribosomal protein L9 [Bacillota bacterium]